MPCQFWGQEDALEKQFESVVVLLQVTDRTCRPELPWHSNDQFISIPDRSPFKTRPIIRSVDVSLVRAHHRNIAQSSSFQRESFKWGSHCLRVQYLIFGFLECSMLSIYSIAFLSDNTRAIQPHQHSLCHIEFVSLSGIALMRPKNDILWFIII